MIQVFHDPESKAFENFNFIIKIFLNRKKFFAYTKEEKEAYAQRINKKIDIFIQLIDKINTSENQNIKSYFDAIKNHFKDIEIWLKEIWMKDDKATIESFYDDCLTEVKYNNLEETINDRLNKIKKKNTRKGITRSK